MVPIKNDGTPSIGIDFGSLYCSVSVFLDGEVISIADHLGHTSIPSYVWYNMNTEKFVVGEEAKKIGGVRDKYNTPFNFKKYISQFFNGFTITEEFKNKPYCVNVDDCSHLQFRMELGSNVRMVKMHEMLTNLLLYLRNLAETNIDQVVRNAVITVPASFNNFQRQAIRSAAEFAGLYVLRILNDSTAAALSYEVNQKKEIRILAVDIGAEFVSVSVVAKKSGGMEVKSSAGALKSNLIGGSNPVFELIKSALVEAGVAIKSIDKLLLSGDFDITPDIQKIISEHFFGKEVHFLPKEAVAHGAAIHAAILLEDKSKSLQDVWLKDVTTSTYGVEVAGQKMEFVIRKNTPLPIKVTKIFSTNVNKQKSIIIQVFEGEHEMTEDNLFAEFSDRKPMRISKIDPNERGVPQFEVTFELDANEFLAVTVIDKNTGNSIRKIIEHSQRWPPHYNKLEEIVVYEDSEPQDMDIVESDSDVEYIQC